MADQPQIKPDPDAGSPFMDEALDETPDLDFYDKLPEADKYSKMYLARLPTYVWQAWSKLDDDAEIEIGKIRQSTDKDGKLKLQMLLRSDLAAHQGLPKEYNMDIVNYDVHNTFIFTEQDLPSFAAKNKEKANALAQGIPAHLLRKQYNKTEQAPDTARKGAPYGRRPIPKKTKIAGRIKHEVMCTPVQNAESDLFLWARTRKSQDPERTVQIFERLPAQGVSDAKEWDNFLKTKEKPIKSKKLENKATRWPENKLLDEIAKCFSQHKYWSIKAFRGSIPQPEAYLRETLDKIAVLHRTGTFANHWSLKPEYQSMVASLPKPADDAAVTKAELPSDDEDEEDIKMEDVL
ncbi:hypothetical protein N656DRAFT_773245 [Canariomyces notabilis]|uniref:Transcription initiation factor IIF subunit beta n=1 Tax=Canariomyces notabilis TaxID=2074819 RepID=A0AAN6TMH4_9PEZI|nr:hypothetical protein N656DRAFT_773245 [Canariomyces arenarius]